MMNKIVGHVICICCLLHTDVVGEITERPLNMATDIGGETVVICSSNISGAITWLYTSDCNTASGTELTDNNCDVISGQTAHYRTEKPDGNTCNLVVSDAVLSLAGCYFCFDGFGVGRQSSAFLIIVDPNANITTNSTDLIPGEGVVISTIVAYRGPTMYPPPLSPSFYWTLQSDPNHNITSYQGSETDTSASSYIVVTAHPPNVPSYLCNLFFNPPNNVPSSGASNAPIYSSNWTTSTYAVSYPPEDIRISGYPTACPFDENVDTPLKCNASGYPSPSYEWVELTKPDEILSTTDTLVIRTDGIYQCTASNVIRGEVNAISTVANISDCFPYVESQTPPSSCDSLCIAILVIAIYFGLNLLFFIIFITYYGCSASGRNTMNDRFPWLKKMLPCMNDQGCKCSAWISYFVLLSIFAAVVFFPVLLIMVYCCTKTKTHSQGPKSGNINSRQVVYVYENEMKQPSDLSEAASYETLQRAQPAMTVYEELTRQSNTERDC